MLWKRLKCTAPRQPLDQSVIVFTSPNEGHVTLVQYIALKIAHPNAAFFVTRRETFCIDIVAKMTGSLIAKGLICG